MQPDNEQHVVSFTNKITFEQVRLANMLHAAP